MHRMLVAGLATATALVVAAGPANAAPLASTKIPSDAAARWQVVAGTFGSKHRADEVLKRLEAKGIMGFSVSSEAAAERGQSSSPDDVTVGLPAAATELPSTSGPDETTERTDAARFEVARVFHRTTATHRDEQTLRRGACPGLDARVRTGPPGVSEYLPKGGVP
ncbi:MAG TPA: hypothetical protein VF984_06720 [Actinomycetota bacterium]